MPRKDPSFTDADLLRLFCKNLDPAEKLRVLEKFKAYVIDRKPICDTDPNIETNFCRWSWVYLELTEHADTFRLAAPKILQALVWIESVLLALSNAGPWGKLVVFLRVAVGWVIGFVTFVATLIELFAETQPYAVALTTFFCKHQFTELSDKTPDISRLPKSYDEKLYEIMEEIHKFSDGVDKFMEDLKKDIDNFLNQLAELPSEVIEDIKKWIEDFDITW